MNDLVEKGKKAAQEAIKRNDAELLARCIEKLKRIGAQVEDIYSAIADCPIELFEKTGYRLNIHSEVAGRLICLGEKPDWATVRSFLQSEGTDKNTLKALFSGETLDLRAPVPEQLTVSLFD